MDFLLMRDSSVRKYFKIASVFKQTRQPVNSDYAGLHPLEMGYGALAGLRRFSWVTVL